jgi:6-phosphofructokinase 1
MTPHRTRATTLRVPILTSGGDAPGMNAVIGGACERIEELGGEASGVRGGFAGLAARRAEPMRAAGARQHAQQPGTWLGTSRWAPLATEEGRRLCGDALREIGAAALIVIGGHGSALGARALAGPVPVAFVPATIDGDIAGTEATVGMDSAVAYGVDVAERLRVTGRSLPGRGFVLQTLGAPTGLLAVAVAAAAGIADVVVPERTHDLDEIARRLRAGAETGDGLVVMSEASGDAVSLSSALADRAGIRVHATILGHAQRAASPTQQDLAMGEAAGRAAVDALAAGRSAFVALGASGAVSVAELAP